MDARTVAIYERHADRWAAARGPRAIDDGRLARFMRRLPRGGRIVDLGCGPGWYAAHLRTRGFRVVAVDVAAAMLRAVPRGTAAIQSDLAALPFHDQSLDGAWAINCYSHMPAAELPLALARLHLALRPGAPIELTLTALSHFKTTRREQRSGIASRRLADDAFVGRLFTAVSEARARELLVGAGFEHIRLALMPPGFWLRASARRARTLPDFITPTLQLLICGLNPSLFSADRGVPFARLGNRFWPAARRAGLIVHERDPLDAVRHRVGLTDLVKRASAASADLRPSEYQRGLQRVASLVTCYQPQVTCFVGLEGWRHAVDRAAQPGWIAGGFAGRPAYLMPSTSGRNARVSLDGLTDHLRRAATGRPAPSGRAASPRRPSN